MAEKVPGEDGPSLELPSLFGRKKKRDTKQPQPDEPPPVQAQPVEPPSVQPQPVEPPSVQAQPVEPPSVQAEDTAVIPVIYRPKAKPARLDPPPPVEPQHRGRLEGRQLPDLAAGTAALLVGAAIGLLGCALTYLGLKGCELVTGTDSCGGPGLLVLVLIIVVMIVVGAAVLRIFGVPEAANLSFLGVGIMVVVALVFLSDYLYSGSMFLVIPVITALSFATAGWVTSKYPDEGASHPEYREDRTYR